MLKIRAVPVERVEPFFVTPSGFEFWNERERVFDCRNCQDGTSLSACDLVALDGDLSILCGVCGRVVQKGPEVR